MATLVEIKCGDCRQHVKAKARLDWNSNWDRKFKVYYVSCPNCGFTTSYGREMFEGWIEKKLINVSEGPFTPYKPEPLKLRTKIFIGVVILTVTCVTLFKFTPFFEEAYSGIISLFGSEAAKDSAAIEVVRKVNINNYIYEGENISDEQLIGNKAAITAFTESGADYRMKGRVEFGYYSSPKNRFFDFWADVDMSYNSQLDVYKFTLSEVLIWNDDGRLDELFGAVKDGVYYIVKEDGKTYVLSEIKDVKTVTDISQDRTVYNFLMRLRMEPIIILGFLNDEKTQRGTKKDGAGYQLYDDSKVSWFKSKYFNHSGVELRTFQNMPVYYYTTHKDSYFDMDQRSKYNFYYNKIPGDSPSAADWK